MGIGIGSNRQGPFLWAFCLSFIPPFPCPTHGFGLSPQPDRSAGMILAARGHWRWLRVTLLTMRSLLYFLIARHLFFLCTCILSRTLVSVYPRVSLLITGRPCLLLYTTPAMQCAFWACISSYGPKFIILSRFVFLCVRNLAHDNQIWKQRFAEPFELPKNGHIHLDAGHSCRPLSHEWPQQHTPDL